jgi:two-component system, OmpR family, response regulator MtrA
VGTAAVPEQAGPVPPLVLLVGEAARDHERVAALLASGSVVVAADDAAAVRTWFPDLLRPRPVVEPDPHVVIRVDELEIDITARRVRHAGRPIDLTEHEIQILAALAGDAGRMWTFGELMAAAWGSPDYGDRSVVHAAIKRLRKKLALAGADLRIEAVRGLGFRLQTGHVLPISCPCNDPHASISSRPQDPSY